MTNNQCDTRILEHLRQRALSDAALTSDPISRQQFQDLAQAYAETATELRTHGVARWPLPQAAVLPWRSVPLWTSNDR